MQKFAENLKQQSDDNPIIFLGVIAALMTAGAKLIDAVGGYRSKQAYAKDANRRVRNSSK